jgi:hypothetical protein
LLVFCDHHTVEFWVSRLDLQQPYEICRDIQEFTNSKCANKVAFTKGRTFDYNNPLIHDNIAFAQYISYLSSISSLVFSFDTEMHDFHLEIYDTCHKSNVYWITSGFINDARYKDNVIPWLYFFQETAHSYKYNLKDKLNELVCDYNKQLSFDVLLGRPRLHRDYVYKSIQEHNMFDNCILNYQTSESGQSYKNFWDNFTLEPNTVATSFGKAGTEQPCIYEGVNTYLSRVIPISIYNKTAYSIIAETNYNNSYSFFTEKTAKPLISRRVFIMFSGYQMLQNLKNLGFKTFDSVIDESYDLIEDDQYRWHTTFQQVKNLSQANQEFVYSTVSEVLEHNYNHIMSIDWTARALEQIKQVIRTEINNYSN